MTTHITTRALLVAAIGTAVSVWSAPAGATDLSRERELTCSDGTTFIGEQVRQGAGRPPGAWRSTSDDDPRIVFTFHAVTVVAPDGSIVESETFDHSQGVDQIGDLVTCSFIIPVGPLVGHRAEFVGFFVP